MRSFGFEATPVVSPAVGPGGHGQSLRDQVCSGCGEGGGFRLMAEMY